MQKIGEYQVPSGYKRKTPIDRILFYHTFDPRVQRDYISFLQTEREFEIKYRNRYTEICKTYKGAIPKDKDWALSTHLYRAIVERKSSSSYEDALKDYWFLCKLKEDYYELESSTGLNPSPRNLPPLSRSQSDPADTSSVVPPLMISKPPNGTSYLRKSGPESPLFGAPKLVYKPRYNYNPRRVHSEYSIGSRQPTEDLQDQALKDSIPKSPTSVRSNPEAHSDVPRYMFRMADKPTMKVSPVYNSEDQRSLTAQNKHLRDLLQTQTEEIKSLRNLDRENQDIVHNLKNRLSSCTCDDNPASVDYTQNTTSREIAQRFVGVYDEEYKTAITTLTNRHQDKLTEDVALYSLMEVIKRCYRLCTAVAAEQVENITSLMKDQLIQPCVTQNSNVQRKVSANDIKRLHDDAMRLAVLFRKRHCTVTITNLTDKFNEELERTPDYKVQMKTPEVSVFIEKCLETIWLMLNQQPPMTLEWPEQGVKFDTTLYKFFKGMGYTVNFPVWPAVLLHSKGPVLTKGLAVPM